MAGSRSSPRIVALVALSMLTVPMTALAGHNSIGYQIQIVDPGEVQDGTLTPDVPHEDHPNADRTSPYHQQFHEGLEELGLDARDAPVDQTGNRYTDCTPYDEAGDDYAPWEENDHCYVGYFDYIKQYNIDTLPLLLPQQPDDLYWANPTDDDEYCSGEEDTNEYTGEDTVDEPLTGIERGLGSYVDQHPEDECGAGVHDMGVPEAIALDMSLVETPLQQGANAAGWDTGSGTWSLPLTGTTYIFLFGQPHPDVDEDSHGSFYQPAEDAQDDRWSAGEGPFSANPAEFGNPLHDMTNACGDRTQECKLLMPADVMEYDHRDDPELPRICGYTPQFSYAPAGDAEQDRQQGACGPQATVGDQFNPTLLGGGFGIDEAPPTYVSNLPGWQWGVFLSVETLANFPGDDGAAFASSPEYERDAAWSVYLDDDDSYEQGYIAYWAVNPKVPQEGDTLDCVIPNFLTDGEAENVPGSFDDPGVYGTYQADAIDSDFYPSFAAIPYEDVVDATHDDVRDVLRPLETAAEDASDTASDGIALSDPLLDEAEALVPEAPEDVDEVVDRAEFQESSQPPAHAQPGDENQHPFEASLSEGLGCDENQNVRFNLPQVQLDVETTDGFSESFTLLLPDASDKIDDIGFLDEEPLVGDDVTVAGLDDVERAGSQHDVHLAFEPGAFDEVERSLFETQQEAWLNATFSPDGQTTTTATWIDAAPVSDDGETASQAVTLPSKVSGETPLDAGISFQAQIGQQTTNIKDPTVFDETGLPAPESETDEGYWQMDLYSFSGEAIAYIDFQQDGTFGSCPGANPAPGDDRCPWQSLWDAYNGDCESFAGEVCGEILRNFGYNIDGDAPDHMDDAQFPDDQAGVGLYFVLELSGTAAASTAWASQDHTRVLNADNPTGTACIAGTSEGFDQYLPNHLEGVNTIEEAFDELCPPGEFDDRVFYDDAFGTQDADTRGGFSSSLEWIKLVPSPDAADIADGDSLCVSGIWSIAEDHIAGDSAGENNINLGEDRTVYEFSHWQSLETGTDTPDDRAEC